MEPSLIANVVAPLLAAHLLVDFLLQTQRDVDGKRRGSASAFIQHGLKHGLAAWALCGMLGAWSLALTLAVVHTAIDAAKIRLTSTLVPGQAQQGVEDDGQHAAADDPQQDEQTREHPPRTGLWLFLGDQALHILSILVLAGLWRGLADAPSFWDWAGLGWVGAAMLVGAGYVAATVVGGHVVGPFVRPFLDEIKRHGPGGSRGLWEGGKTIGLLERTLIFVLILAGIESGVGFLVAAKSILRFGELKDTEQRMEAEYIIIGTFLSFTWAIGCGCATRALLAVIGWGGGG